MILERRDFPTLESLAQALADFLAEALRTALIHKPLASLAVSGGQTPKRVLPLLAAADLDWSRIVVTLTDERWVPQDHPDSNEALTRALLPVPPARFVSLYGGETTPRAGWAAAEARLGTVPWPLDAVFLGMGADGHFASLFPGDSALSVQRSRSAPARAPNPPQSRSTLTYQSFIEAGRLALAVTDAAKRAALAKAMAVGPVAEAPLRLLEPRTQPLVAFVLS
ncbi:MAG: 6-phosphogluconolactonase [Rhodospirillales bacterium]|nr:6-phosphogluconolactonase [Rhodospirillales bacterium]